MTVTENVRYTNGADGHGTAVPALGKRSGRLSRWTAGVSLALLVCAGLGIYIGYTLSAEHYQPLRFGGSWAPYFPGMPEAKGMYLENNAHSVVGDYWLPFQRGIFAVWGQPPQHRALRCHHPSHQPRAQLAEPNDWAAVPVARDPGWPGSLLVRALLP
jgi:hypothetical protein